MDVGKILKLIKKPYATVQDIMVIAGIGRNRAYKIKQDILDKLEEQGKPMFDNRYIPMDILLKKINFNKKYFLEANNGK